MTPLFDLLRGGEKTLTWTEEAVPGFIAAAKEILAGATVLSHPAPSSDLSLVTDASDRAVGAVLQQWERGAWRPLGFFSKRLQPAETRLQRLRPRTSGQSTWPSGTSGTCWKDGPSTSSPTTAPSSPPSPRSPSLGRPGSSGSSAQSPSTPRICATFQASTTRSPTPSPGRSSAALFSLPQVPRSTRRRWQRPKQTTWRRRTSPPRSPDSPSRNTTSPAADTNCCVTSAPAIGAQCCQKRGGDWHFPWCIISATREFASRSAWSYRGSSGTGPRPTSPTGRRPAWTASAPKSTNTPRPPVHQIPDDPGRFRHVHVDIVGPLPPSRGARYLLTAVDRTTRWPEAFPMEDMEAMTCVNTFLEGWVGAVRHPGGTHVGQRGTVHFGSLGSVYFDYLGTACTTTTAYHPAANGSGRAATSAAQGRSHRLDSGGQHVEGRSCHGSCWGLGRRPKDTEGTTEDSTAPFCRVFGGPVRLPADLSLPPARQLRPGLRRGDRAASAARPQRWKALIWSLGPAPTRPWRTRPPPPSTDRSAAGDGFGARLRRDVESGPTGDAADAGPRRPRHVDRVHLPKELESCQFVFVLRPPSRPALTAPYEGPFRVVSREEKYFVIDFGSRQDRVSIDRLKPARTEPGFEPAAKRGRGRPRKNSPCRNARNARPANSGSPSAAADTTDTGSSSPLKRTGSRGPPPTSVRRSARLQGRPASEAPPEAAPPPGGQGRTTGLPASQGCSSPSAGGGSGRAAAPSGATPATSMGSSRLSAILLRKWTQPSGLPCQAQPVPPREEPTRPSHEGFIVSCTLAFLS